jgi:hypothetical protein
MERLTRRRALEVTRALFNWAVRNPGADKREYPDWEEYERRYGVLAIEHHYCACCHYADHVCSECPLIELWQSTGYVGHKPPCLAPGTPYCAWSLDGKRSRHAQAIADACTAELKRMDERGE